MIFEIRDSSHVGEARRRATACAEELGLSEAETGAAAIVVTELASNILKHAHHGSVILDPLIDDGSAGLRMFGLDKGPGILDLSRALEDGHSTAGTGGNGLGAVQRLSDVFEVFSGPGLGTGVLAEVWKQRKRPKPKGPVEVGVISIPVHGETVCGDGFSVRRDADSLLLMVADGLGHGLLAAEAAREAEATFAQSKPDSLTSMLRDCHDALKKTRGAALAMAKLQHDRQVITWAGVGNISGSIAAPASSRGMASHNGTVGQQFETVQEFSYPWNEGSVLVMHSDGLMSRWDLGKYPGIWSKPASLISAILYRDYYRGRDDVTVLVAKNRPHPSCS